MAIRQFDNKSPHIANTAYVDEAALVIGDVHIGADASIWPGVVVRGDINTIKIGERTNVQDNSVIHVTHDSEFEPGGFKTIVGNDVTVGHRVILHGCTIGDRCLIGMGSIIMDNVEIDDQVIIAAGSLVSPGKHLESGYLWVGSPARPIRPLNDKEIEFLSYSATHYARLKNRHGS